MGNTSRLAVLLFTDLVGSTELMNRIGNAAFMPLMERHNAIFESICRDLNGEILKHTGDGFFAAFPTASDAVRVALRFQRALREEPWPHPLAARVGIHIGEVASMEMAGRQDVIGVAADLAARVMSIGVASQILLTRTPFNDARQFVSEPDLRWVAHGPYLFKGIDEPLDVFEVGAEGLAPLAVPPNTEKARRVVPHDQEPTLGWRPAMSLAIPGRPGWDLERKLGEGGFGEVWLGQHGRTKQHRVFKFCFDAERLRSFKREMTLFRLLREALGDRPDIAKLYEVKFDEPPFFLESEYTNGGNLGEWADREGGLKKVPLQKRLDLVAKVADAVAAAHSVGILHKDIKPSNVLIQIEPDGSAQPRLGDFGIGFLSDRSQLAARQITETGFTAISENDSSRTGTRMYSPPEQLAGRPFTTQSDVFALGIMLLQIVIGDLTRPLAEGWERDVDDELLREDIAACIEGDPQRRVGSASLLAMRLRTLPERRAQRRRDRRRRTLLRGAMASAAVLLLLCVVGVAGYLRERGLRGRALAAESDARGERDRAELLLADSRIIQGDLLSESVDVLGARESYDEAARLLMRRGKSTIAADVGLAESYSESEPPLLSFLAHDDEILTADLSDDGRTAISGGKDKVLKLWEVCTGRLLQSFSGSEHWILASALSSDGKLAITGGGDGTARIWNLETGAAGQVFRGHTGPVRAVAFSLDLQSVLSGGEDRVLRVWRVSDGRETKTFGPHSSKIISIAVSPDGSRAFVGIDGVGTTASMLWDLNAGTSKAVLTNSARTAAFFPDGNHLAVGSYDKPVYLVGLQSDKPASPVLGSVLQQLTSHSDFVLDLDVAANGRTFVSGSNDRRLVVWTGGFGSESVKPTSRVVTGSTSAEGGFSRSRILYGATDGLRAAKVSADGRIAMAAGLDRHIRIWDLSPPTRSEFLAATNKFAVSFSAGGRIISQYVHPGFIYLHDAATGQLLDIQHLQSNAEPLLSGDFITSGNEGSGLPVSHVLDGRVIGTLPVAGKCTGFEVSERGEVALCTLNSNTLQAWEISPAKMRWERVTKQPVIRAAALSADGRLALSANDAELILQDGGTGNTIARFTTPGDRRIFACAISTDGKLGIFGTELGSVVILDLVHGVELRRFSAATTAIRSVAFCDNNNLALTCTAGNVGLWDVATGRQLHKFTSASAVASQTEPVILIDALGGSYLNLSLPSSFRKLADTLADARKALQANPNDAAALGAFGNWFALRGELPWAIEFLERARQNGTTPSPLLLARCYWQNGDAFAAEREFRAAKQQKLAPADYLDLCMAAVSRSTSDGIGLSRASATTPTSAPASDAIAVTDSAAIGKLLGNVATFEGVVAKVAPTLKRDAWNVTFVGVHAGGAQLWIPPKLLRDLQNQRIVSKNAEIDLVGKRLRIRGRLEFFREILEIIPSSADDIQILGR